MARYFYKTLAPSVFPAEQPYCLRANLQDEGLSDSVGRCGVFQPLIITRQLEILSGHKRLAAAKNYGLKELEVLEVCRDLAPQEAFLLALLSNWHKPLSDFEKARVVFLAAEKFNFKQAEILQEVFPALGLDPEQHLYEDALELMSLQPELLDLIAQGKIPSRGAKSLKRFTSDDQKAFAKTALAAAFTTNQILKAGEWLLDLSKTGGKPAAVILSGKLFQDILHSDRDRKAKGELIFQQIRDLRFPQVAAREKQFEGLSGQLKEAKSGLSAEMPPFFESEGFTLKAHLKSPESLDAVIKALQDKRKVLNSLLDIVL